MCRQHNPNRRLDAAGRRRPHVCWRQCGVLQLVLSGLQLAYVAERDTLFSCAR